MRKDRESRVARAEHVIEIEPVGGWADALDHTGMPLARAWGLQRILSQGLFLMSNAHHFIHHVESWPFGRFGGAQGAS